MDKETLQIIKNDPWLEPFEKAIKGRYEYYKARKEQLLESPHQGLGEFASGYLYFGLQKTDEGWTFREWAPHATAIYLTGNFSDWKEKEAYKLNKIENGKWEILLPADAIHPGDLYKMKVYWDGGSGERIPAWSKYVVQDKMTGIFCAKVQDPAEAYRFRNKNFHPSTRPLLIYECHVGMATNEERVGTYKEFTEYILPRIKDDGYNAIQLMAIQEHPYYGSFGYHVSSFFAPSSRFGTPDQLKELIDTAHSYGITVIMDLVHSHAVKNEVEGLAKLDGTEDLYFQHEASKRYHPAWDSLCFDYGKNEVIHFLLSNCKYWLDEFQFDGFRFDGVTSMLYYNHGLGEAFSSYKNYFDGQEDPDAICYLTLANDLIHEYRPEALSIAEEVSGMPGLAAKTENGGYGFDYRLAMNIPDFWIKTIKEKKDEAWNTSSIWWESTNRRADEKTISYAESHDQALVGDKTIIFRLIDSDMYWHMRVNDKNLQVERGIALHKMIRLVTASTINGGYLNFMGNEFGHPEWVDFPRQGNHWSYKYAKRQWNLVDDKNLKYFYLGDFDKAMIRLIRSIENFQATSLIKLWDKPEDQILAFLRDTHIFIFNFNPLRSYSDYGILAPPGEYENILDSDAFIFGGQGRIDDTVRHFTIHDPLFDKEQKAWLKLYLPTRTALVLRKIPEQKQNSKTE